MAKRRKPPDDGEAEIISFERAKEELKAQLEANRQSLNEAIEGTSEKDYLLELNKRHAFIKSFGGKPAITNLLYNDVVGKEVLEFISPDAFQVIYSNESVQTGKSTWQELGKWWVRNYDRRSYDTVIFDPSKGREHNNCLNLWEGFATEPKQGIWKATLKHIYTILCNSDNIKFKYFVKWLAWAVQNPAYQAEVCVIFKGKEGAGKGFIFTQFVEMFGVHGFTLANRELLTGKHNGHLQRIVFLFADEAYYPGDKEAEGVLKQLITQPVISYRAMFREAIQGANRLHIGMSTNNEWVIPAGTDSRRYFINEVDNKYAKGECSDLHRDNYFTKLWQEMQHGGRAAMLYDLSKMFLGDWHPRKDVPQTNLMERQRELNLNPLQSAIFSIVDNGIFPGYVQRTMYVMPSKQFNDWLLEIEPKTVRFSSVKTAEMIKFLGAKKIRKAEGIWWEFPSLEDMRNNWKKEFGGGINWDMSETWIVPKKEY